MIVDKSLHFGNQNYFFHDSIEDLDYDYVLYVNRKGAILIARYTKDGNSSRYTIKTGNYDIVLAAKATYDYVVISALIDPAV